MKWGMLEIIARLAGIVSLAIGLWFLLFWRPAKKLKVLKLAGERRPAHLTEPTRLVVSLVCLIWGYHFIVWTLPPQWVGVQLLRDVWYVWVLIGIVLIVFSLGLDARERSSRPPDE